MRFATLYQRPHLTSSLQRVSAALDRLDVLRGATAWPYLCGLLDRRRTLRVTGCALKHRWIRAILWRMVRFASKIPVYALTRYGELRW